MPAPEEKGYGATPAEALAHSQMIRSDIESMPLDLEKTRRRIKMNEHRFAVQAASALAAGFTYTEIAGELEGMTPFKIRSAIQKAGAKADDYLVRKYAAQKVREPGLSLGEAAEALGLGTHAVMMKRRNRTIDAVLGKNGIHHRYFLPETTDGSDEGLASDRAADVA